MRELNVGITYYWTESIDLIDYKQGGFRARVGGGGIVHQIFTLVQIGEKAREKNVVNVGFIDLQKAHREALWHVLMV